MTYAKGVLHEGVTDENGVVHVPGIVESFQCDMPPSPPIGWSEAEIVCPDPEGLAAVNKAFSDERWMNDPMRIGRWFTKFWYQLIGTR